MESANATSFRSASSGSSPTSVAASIITGTITNAIDAATAAIASLTATDVVATNATTTNATTTNLYVSGRASLPATTVIGDLTVSGTISGGTLAVSGLSSGGAIEAPYFTATPSTVTSTFAGGVGIATSSPLDTLGVNGALGLGTINTNAIVNVRNAATSASLQVEFPDLDPTGGGVVRLFRNTNTTGSLSFKIYKLPLPSEPHHAVAQAREIDPTVRSDPPDRDLPLAPILLPPRQMACNRERVAHQTFNLGTKKPLVP